MQPCLPAPKARRSWRASIASSAFGWVTAQARRTVLKRSKNGIGMVETTEKTGEKKLSVSSGKTLSLKGRGVEQGVVRQSFSHGRTKAVVVEKVKSRTLGKAHTPVAPSALAGKRPAAGKAATAAPAAAP